MLIHQIEAMFGNGFDSRHLHYVIGLLVSKIKTPPHPTATISSIIVNAKEGVCTQIGKCKSGAHECETIVRFNSCPYNVIESMLLKGGIICLMEIFQVFYQNV